jgi:hypothetical protein
VSAIGASIDPMLRRGVVAVLSGVPLALAACSLLTDLDGLSTGGPRDGDAASLTDATAPLDSPSTADGMIPFDAASVPDGGSAYVTAVLDDKPIAYYPLEESQGSVARDVIAGKDGLFVGTDRVVVPGRVGNGASFDGAKTRLEMPLGAFGFPNRAPFTLELWVKASVVDQAVRFVAQGGPSGTIAGYLLYYTDTYTQTARTDTDGGSDSYCNRDPFQIGQLTHVVMAYDGTEMRLYTNGVASPPANGFGSNAGTDQGRLVLGDRNPPNFAKFAGVLDEIAIYDKALSAQRVKAHFDAAPK